MPHSKVITRALLLIAISLYTAFSAGPFAWTAMLSLRTTSEISKAPYAWPESFRWQKYVEAWTGSNYDTYFLNSMVITVLAVLVTTIGGAMAARCLARYRFRGNRIIYFIIWRHLCWGV